MKKILIIALIFNSFVSYSQIIENDDVVYLQAIELSDSLLFDMDAQRSDFRLISIENMLIKGEEFIGPDIWHLTYKLKSIIPEDDKGMVGAGGEIFIEVNTKKRIAKILGYGE
jgi:hypothetical protein